MKAKLILINWCISLFGLCVDVDNSPLWVVFTCVVYFIGSSLLLVWADQKGILEKISKKLNIDEE